MSDSDSVNHLGSRQRLLLTFTFFSMFFGAGNLIFPPLLGAQAGQATPLATLGFIISAVGLPILAVLVVAKVGGFSQLASRVSPRFALVLGVVIMLAIGPCCAIPRTATTSFEMAVGPFAGSQKAWLARLVYSLVFFALSLLFSQHPERLSKVLGRITTPLLLALIVILFIACLLQPQHEFKTPMGPYATGQLTRGFVDGYQTMDLLAALYFGIVISANVHQLGILDSKGNRHETGLAGAGTGVLLVIIYGVLSYIGAFSGSLKAINPASDTGATVLTNLTGQLFGSYGTAFVGLIFVIACFNVCTGLISTCSSYFAEHFHSLGIHQLTYRFWTILFAFFSFLVSNAGLSAIITVSLPVLSALYPIAIVLVLLGFAHQFSDRFSRVYAWTVLLVAIYSIVNCLLELAQVFGFAPAGALDLMGSLPLYSEQLTWLIPALLGLVIGTIDSLIRGPQDLHKLLTSAKS
ncbi:branched-chain amino acid transport system II carrier protein [Bifidobacterium aemilianum]|uniref:Branched-chain amino acid transport system II carrier protein n=1 Tax=Bifidobacterium aemilianum TaxID=2493120 RepID=A0A366KA67_9BIFI|nr:branched-chain amino acid transport system II carrier protein [Bifidobacterium aemilianum]RBP98122.1 branched-chain amino acid transport system II carrier protein [Bifidobacterium aemilianum]